MLLNILQCTGRPHSKKQLAQNASSVVTVHLCSRLLNSIKAGGVALYRVSPATSPEMGIKEVLMKDCTHEFRCSIRFFPQDSSSLTVSFLKDNHWSLWEVE